MTRIDTETGRSKLRVRREPHWHKLAREQHLGFRKLDATTGTWIARYRDGSGRRHYRALGEHSPAFGFDEASKAARAWFADMEVGVRGDATVAQAVAAYLANLRAEKGDTTADNQEQRLKRILTGIPKRKIPAHTLAGIRLDKLTAAHVEGWRDSLVPAGLDAAATRAKKNTASRDLNRLKAALTYAYSKGMVSSNAGWRGVKPFKGVEKRREVILDLDQRRALLASAGGKLRDFIEAVMLTGCRMGELTALRVSAFDSRSKTLTVSGKTGRRTFPVSPPAAALFARLAKDKLPGAYLLTRDDGKPWGHSDWDEAFKVAAKAAGLPAGTVMYSLRHTFITEALMGGMNTLEVSRITGTSMRMIDKHYGHLSSSTTAARLATLVMS